jgi:mono/diheme cytochrome c family protein
MINRCTPLLLLLGLALALPAAGRADDKAAAMELGKQKYMVCGACHGLDGKGMMAGPMKMAPAYADSKLVASESAEIMAIAVMKGIKKEDAKFLQIMMPLETALDDAALAAVLTYVRNTYGGKTDLVTAEQTKAWREKYKGITAPVTRAELEKWATSGLPK